MSKKPLELEHVMEELGALSDAVGNGFQRVEDRLERIELIQSETSSRITDVEAAQREANERLSNLENRFKAYEADIKELYGMLAELQRDTASKKLYGVRLEKRLAAVEAFAVLLSKKTGVKFK